MKINRQNLFGAPYKIWTAVLINVKTEYRKTVKANANPELLNVSDGLVVKNIKRNVVGSREQLSFQTTLEGGRHEDASIIRGRLFQASDHTLQPLCAKYCHRLCQS